MVMTRTLSTTDLATIARKDDALIGLPLLWDPSRLWRQVTANGLHAARLVATPELVYSRYKPGRRCLSLYHTASGQDGPTWFYAVAHVSESWPKYRARFEGVQHLCPDWRIWTLPDHRIALHPFPADPRLRIGRLFGDVETRSEFLQRLFPTRKTWWCGELKLLAYKPERRCAAALYVAGTPVAVLKFYASGDFESALARARFFRSKQPLQVAGVIGRSHRHRVLAFPWIPGETWQLPVACNSNQTSQINAIGAALARVHAHDVGTASLPHLANMEPVVSRIVDDMALLVPHESRRLTNLKNQLIALWQQNPRWIVCSHGDFYARQVITGHSATSIIDFDQARLDDRHVDLGNFVAHARYDLMRSRGGRFGSLEHVRHADIVSTDEDIDPLCHAIAAAISQGYGSDNDHQVDARQFSVAIALGLVRLLPRPFRCHEPNWVGMTASLIDAIDRELDRAGAESGAREIGNLVSRNLQKPPTSDESTSTWQDNDMPWVVDALVPELATAMIRDCASDPIMQKQSVQSAHVLRHKQGRRCLIAYELSTSHSDAHNGSVVLGKVRAKGLDERTFRLHREIQLHHASTLERYQMQVPRAIGVYPQWKMWLQLKMPGDAPWQELIINRNIELAQRIASGIAAFHRLPVVLDRQHHLRDELTILKSRLEPMIPVHPQGKTIAQVLDRCQAIAASMTHECCSLIHRDFYPDQLLIHHDQIVLLDLDLCCMGDGALDVGNFLAHLVEWSVRNQHPVAKLHPCMMAISETYVAERQTTSLKQIHDYLYLSLARHIELSTRIPGRAATTLPLIDLLADIG